MLFDAIFLGLLIAGWTVCAAAPWVIASIRTKGETGCLAGLLCVFAGNVAAMTVPILGFDGSGGLRASFAVAVIVPALLLLARAFAAQPVRRER